MVKVPNKYKVNIDENEGRLQYSVMNEEHGSRFCPIDRKVGGKIYLVFSSETVKYVGRTFQPMSGRFSDGINGREYKWAQEKRNNLHVLTWHFENIDDFGLEAIESELTLAVRAYQKCWPTHQTSINFRWVNETEYAHLAQDFAILMIEHYADQLKFVGSDTNKVDQDLKKAQHLLKEMRTCS
ncbi:hypothetical protein MSG34_18630 [Vibrio sp. 1CM2L]|uniref:hypothetical protein n=1 Tax=Vibrio sp. 1CM2L TaxID=2929166 RepID=UPI0020BFE56F|nr:hypothetical protein [Vibrio sp. 1CM2L]MCK8078180.1 hypothetical protein [Vibrio sp. 1CM2L]